MDKTLGSPNTTLYRWDVRDHLRHSCSPSGELVSFSFPELETASFATTDCGPVPMDSLFVFPHNQAEFRVVRCPSSIMFNCFNYFKMTITRGLQADVLIFSGTILPAETFNMRSQVSHSVHLVFRYSKPNSPPMLLVSIVPVRGV
ncbi:hypothetical protein TNCV_3882731 [Trichonephila clavipes]|nr:hypothetical protein TNCV_3882731 [Trichonephila clavipes]